MILRHLNPPPGRSPEVVLQRYAPTSGAGRIEQAGWAAELDAAVVAVTNLKQVAGRTLKAVEEVASRLAEVTAGGPPAYGRSGEPTR